MSTFLTLLVACCAARGVSSAATPLRFTLDYDNPELVPDGSPPAALSHRRSIFFPGEASGDGGSGDLGEITSSADATGPTLLLPDGFIRDGASVEPPSGCVYHNLTTSYNGTSWKLLTRGECPEGEWTVMVAECQPGCRPQPCPLGQLEYEGRCVDPSDPTVCGEEQILYLTTRGTTYCDCEQNYFYVPWSDQCYARRKRGRCDFGFFLDINENGNVECMPNECKMDTLEKDPITGKCFRKDFEGYCPLNDLEFHYNNRTVGCLILHIRNLFDRAITHSCAPGSRVDHLGRCRQEVVVPSITSMPRSLTGGCREGSIRIGDGPCRRVNNYL